ncbi:MAG TPA: GNAT family protein [Ignavibacteria bacterium]|jgi:RimJ/RimL family protein N-acetyltransferase
MQINFTELKIEDKNDLINFLVSERWEFHSLPEIPPGKVIEQLNNGYFTGKGKKTFLISGENRERIGVIRLFDLGDDVNSTETPLFDLKIKKEFRNKGIGKNAVRWLTEYVFNYYPNKDRLEATTRYDNIAMRKVLEECCFVKEAHYRLAWSDENGNKYDCTGYGILRSDWENKTKTPVNFEK